MTEPLRPEPWIRLDGVDFYHGRQRVLEEIDLTLLPGRHYILAGPNGAGKSTLLDCLARLRVPARGTITLMDSPLSGYEPGALARLLALAPQEYALDFAFTVREVTAMGRRPYLGRWGRMDGADEDAVEAALADMGLAALAGKPVTALSGGERRRCVVARALAQATPVLLLDEPAAGLDIAQALAVMALARRLAESGRLVVTVSHDLNLAAAFGHELIFLKDGRIEESGPVSEVFSDATLSRIYATPSRVRFDEFSGALSAAFRTESE